MNEHFSSAFTDEKAVDAQSDVKNVLLEGNNHMLSNIVKTREEIIKRLRNLVVNKAPAVDGNVPRVLMECAYCSSGPIEYAYIYIESLITTVAPNDWKRANVAANYKKDHLIYQTTTDQLV